MRFRVEENRERGIKTYIPEENGVWLKDITLSYGDDDIPDVTITINTSLPDWKTKSNQLAKIKRTLFPREKMPGEEETIVKFKEIAGADLGRLVSDDDDSIMFPADPLSPIRSVLNTVQIPTNIQHAIMTDLEAIWKERGLA